MEVIDGVKIWCYAEKVKLTEEALKKHNELCVKCIPENCNVENYFYIEKIIFNINFIFYNKYIYKIFFSK